MGGFAVAVVKRPEISCAGIKVATTMERASVDCPALWAAFGPRMGEVPADAAYGDQSFGASVMKGESDFEYWAVKPIAAGAGVPEGMEAFTLPGGEYVECPVSSLAELGGAYTYIYSEWPKEHPEFDLLMQGVGYEKYTMDFMKTGGLVLYSPLVRK